MNQQMPARTWRLCLIGLFALAVLVRLACFTGLIASDDLWYSTYAQRIAAGLYPQEANQFAGRAGVTIPVAVMYRVLGVSEATTIALPLLASSATVSLVAAIGALLFTPLTGLVAGLLLCTSPIHLRYATILVPEPMMEFWIALAVWCYVVASARGSRVLAAAAGMAVGVAYLTKEPAAIVAPALMATAWITGKRSLAVAVACGALAVAAAEMSAYQVAFGDPLHRVHMARTGVFDYVNASPEQGVTPTLGERLFKAYPRQMLFPNVDFGLHYVAAIGLGAVGFAVLRHARALLVLWAALPWAFLNFGSASVTQYLPPWPAARYISLTLPPLFILGAAALTAPSPWQRVLQGKMSAILLAAVMVIGVGCGLETRGTGGRSAHVATLRSIVRVADGKDVRVCPHSASDIEGVDFAPDDVSPMWSAAVGILAPQVSDVRPGAPGLLLEPNALGLPAVREGVCGSGQPAARLGDRS